ncbi:MAG: hypothetical protein PVG82_00535 [Chromatiales bacterium]
MKELLSSYAQALGPLRLSLAALAVIAIAFMPPPRTPVDYEGWGFAYTVLMPVLAPLVFMVLMLDLLMSRVFMSSVDDGQRARYRVISVVNLVLGVAVMVRFLPFLLALSR